MNNKPIAGIDMPRALERLVNNYGLLVKVVKGLAAEMEEGVPAVLVMIDEGKFEEASKMCHRFKGVSSNISADELYETLTHAESACNLADASSAKAGLQKALGLIQASNASL